MGTSNTQQTDEVPSEIVSIAPGLRRVVDVEAGIVVYDSDEGGVTTVPLNETELGDYVA